MDERHAQPEQAHARLLVDQLGAGGGGIGQGLLDVVDRAGDVVHAGAAVLQELADRRVVTQRPQQLDAAVAEQHRGRLHTLIGHRLAVLEHAPQQLLVVGDGGVEVVDGMPDMMDRLRAHCARILVGHIRKRAANGGCMGFLDKIKQQATDVATTVVEKTQRHGQDGSAADAAAQPQGRGEGGAGRPRRRHDRAGRDAPAIAGRPDGQGARASRQDLRQGAGDRRRAAARGCRR